MTWKLWLDDLRQGPTGTKVQDGNGKTVDPGSGAQWDQIEALDLDHDLGDYADQGGDAIRLLDWLAERETFYPVEIHTANPVGRANMERILARYWGEQYW